MDLDINRIIHNGETFTTEFKSGEFHNDSLAKEIVAFSNMSGGEIFIGISDNGVIEGVDYKRTEERVIQICRNNVIPPVIPEIFCIHANGKQILQLVIEKGKFKPYKVRSSNTYYIRLGSVSIEPTNEELIRLFQDGSQLHIEAAKLPGTTIDHIFPIIVIRSLLRCSKITHLLKKQAGDFRRY